MSVLPASVRVALWASAAFAEGGDLERAVGKALPDIDHCTGLVEALRGWQSVGEQAVLCALVRPGDVTRMPQGSQDLAAAATDAEELIYVPGIGGALVPTIEPFGPPGDQGWATYWHSFPADPMPVHRVQALDLGQVAYQLRTDLVSLTDELSSTPSGFGGAAGLEQAARDRLAGQWGVPEGLPPRALRTIDLAASAASLARSGLDHRIESLDVTTAQRRAVTLRQLRDQADDALCDATNAAILHLVGWR